MNEEQFWQLIQSVHLEALGDMDSKCSLITEKISSLKSEDAIAFQTLFDKKMDEAYSWELWGAAYVLGGGCSDDSFTDFRSSLISRGKASFQAALLFPDSLAEQILDEDTLFYEGYQYAVTDGVEAVAGSDFERHSALSNDPSGQAWEESDDALKELYPNLWKKVQSQTAPDFKQFPNTEKLEAQKNKTLSRFFKLQILAVVLIIVVYVLYHYF